MLKRKNIHAKMFDDMMLKRLNQMMDLVEEAYEVMIENLKNPYLTDISNAMDAEYNINGFRNDVREEHIVNLESGQYNYLAGVYYMDIASELEKIGDFIINISEAQVIREDY
jgi:phosphate:Na+ symporter